MRFPDLRRSVSGLHARALGARPSAPLGVRGAGLGRAPVPPAAAAPGARSCQTRAHYGWTLTRLPLTRAPPAPPCPAAGDFVQILHVVDKSEKFIDELLHTGAALQLARCSREGAHAAEDACVRAADIRLKCAAINDPAVDFVFDRLAPKLAAANVEHRINVLRCSQAARSVGDVVVTNATRIKASMVVMAMKARVMDIAARTLALC